MARILLIDDDAEMRAVLSYWLTLDGHDVTERPNGRAALETLAREEFDLALSDVFMPDGDGLEFLQQLRARQSTMPVMLMSAGGMPQFDPLDVGRRLGACATLWKPVAHRTLSDAIRCQLQERGGSAAGRQGGAGGRSRTDTPLGTGF